MQKFLLEMTHAGPGCRTLASSRVPRGKAASSDGRPHEAHRSRQRLRRQVRQRQRLGLGLGQRAVRQGDPAHGRAGEPAQHLPVATSRACRPGTRCASRERGWLGRRGGVDLMVAMNPQTWDAGRRRDRAGRLPVLRLAPSRCRRREVPRRHHRASACR
ncbi:MAG: hypothetical protein MZW92_36030 [Comamonadaceae bacterium]|nr:hypothetical protein [Comamonadaceae bacterium]